MIETVKALTNLLNAFTNFVMVAGAWPTAAIVIGVTNAWVVIPWVREHNRNKKPDLVVKHMEEEIRRLADDNKQYREVYLARIGFPAEALRVDAADSKAESEKKGHGGKKS